MHRTAGGALIRYLLGAVLFCACAAPSPSQLPVEDTWLISVESSRLPESSPWYRGFAHHSWIDVRQGAESNWLRIEVWRGVAIQGISSQEAHADVRWDHEVEVLQTMRGPAAERAAAILLELAENTTDYGQLELTRDADGGFHGKMGPSAGRDYRAWPGPNSNTFIATLIEETPGLHAELHHNAVGKDYPNGLRAGWTSSGLGVELDTPLLGVGLGLRQGVELHLLGLTVGIGLWPPAIKLPFLPRIGAPQAWPVSTDT